MNQDTVELTPALPTPYDGSLRKLLAIWSRFQGPDRPVPRKSEVVPFPIAHYLSKVWLYRYLPRQQDFECRVVGDDVLKAWQIHMGQGDRLSDVQNGLYFETLYPRWHRVVTVPCIMHAFCEGSDHAKQAERLALPLADDDGIPCYILGVTQYTDYSDNLVPVDPSADVVRFHRIKGAS